MNEEFLKELYQDIGEAAEKMSEVAKDFAERVRLRNAEYQYNLSPTLEVVLAYERLVVKLFNDYGDDFAKGIEYPRVKDTADYLRSKGLMVNTPIAIHRIYAHGGIFKLWDKEPSKSDQLRFKGVMA